MNKVFGISTRLWLLLISVATIAAYLQGLFGGFLFDDHQNIVNNAALQSVDGSFRQWMIAALSSHTGMLMRPLSMLTFAANFYISGLDPVAFKATNLAIHVGCGLLLYALSLQLVPKLSSDRHAGLQHHMALLIAAAWLLHPLQVSNVLYVVQRMNQLATLFTLLGLLYYAIGRNRMLRGEAGLSTAIGGLLLFTVLSVLCKENGALTFAYALVIELFCFRFAAPTSMQRTALKLLYLLCVAVPLMVFATYVALNPEWLPGSYAHRTFTLYERVLTQPRILAHYVLWIFVPLPQLMGIYHDDIPISSGLLTPPSTLLALLAFGGLVGLAWLLRQRAPAFGFAVLWFLVGHAMESTIIPLEMIFEHRNYLPMAGLLLGTSIQLATLMRQLPAHAGAVAATVILAGLTTATAVRAHTWGDPYRLAISAASDHPTSPRSVYDAGRAIYEKGLHSGDGDGQATTLQATQHFQRAMAIDPAYVHPAVSNILVNYDRIETPEAVVGDLARRMREVRRLQPTPILLLLRRIADKRVLMSATGVQSIFEAAMENASTSPAARAMLLSAYGRYHFLVLNDAQSAVSLTIAATEQDPRNPIVQINLANLALELRQLDVAEKAAHRAAALDLAGVHRDDVAKALSKVAALRKQSS